VTYGHAKLRPVSSALSADAFADPKPLTLKGLGSKPLGSIKALPPIGAGGLAQMSGELDDKKRRAAEEIRMSMEQLADQKKKEGELRAQVRYEESRK
jgi:hypothetical protein